jgi:hypothetical protein
VFGGEFAQDVFARRRAGVPVLSSVLLALRDEFVLGLSA